VEIRRRLAQADPSAFEPDLAISLNNLGIYLSAAGRQEEALAAYAEVVEIRRRLAQADPSAFEPDLARSLGTFAEIRVALEAELVEAFASIRESVAVYRRLSRLIPGAFTSDLRACLGTAADVLDGLGRQEDAMSLRHLVEAGAMDEGAGCFRK
jgi:tetratricopeptide (TPR) repeat protein